MKAVLGYQLPRGARQHHQGIEIAPAEIERFLELVQRLPELTADEVSELTIVAAIGVLAGAPAPKGLF